ncbi:DNA cross-link repair 1A protein [Acipenser ruthenus]|uniref:DNA cross-link repair 1A protein n=1 Tax=Acipenser ruthenus TaxID=7906 RepID=A0A444ULH3_ACIRT|nr:DNA cross-link repair 1A protein [Acipenser ruthenus]
MQAATGELNSEVHSSKRKPRQRKRKATSSIGDSAEQEAVDGSNNNEALTPKEKGSRPRRRGWCKGGSAKEPENGDVPATRRCPFYKNIPAIADVLGCKVCVSWDKYNIMCCLESERIKELITMDWDATQLHVLPMMQVSYKAFCFQYPQRPEPFICDCSAFISYGNVTKLIMV